MKAKSQIQQRLASTKPISIYNKYLKKDQLKIAIKASDDPSRDKKREKLIDSSTMVPAGSIWNLTNVGKEALHVNIVLRK